MAPTTRPRRKEAQRNLDAILDAAVDVLAERADASMGEVARTAGVSRQTVYAHFHSREQLLDATVARAMARAVERIDATQPERGPADDALCRLLDVSWTTIARHGALLDAAIKSLPPETFRARHRPVAERLEQLIERGQREGAFDPELPVRWLLATFLGLVHSAGQEVLAGRLAQDAAAAALRTTVLKAFGPAPVQAR